MERTYGAILYRTSGVGEYGEILGSDKEYLYCSSQGEIGVWERNKYTLVLTLKGSGAITIDSNYLMTTDLIWSKKSWEPIHSLDIKGWIRAIADDEKYLYLRGNNHLHVFNKSTWENIINPGSDSGLCHSIAMDDDSVYVGGSKYNPVSGRGYIWRYSKRDWSLIKEYRVHSDHITRMQIVGDKLYFAGWNIPGITILDKETLQKVDSLNTGHYKDDDFLIDENGIYVFNGKELSLWDLKKKSAKQKYTFEHDIAHINVDYPHIMCALRGGGISILDKKFKQVIRLPKSERTVASACTDRKYFYSGFSDGSIKVQDQFSFNDIATLKMKDRISGIAADGACVYATAGYLPAIVSIWEANSWKLFLSLEGEREWLNDMQYGNCVYGLQGGKLIYWFKDNPDKRYEFNLPFESGSSRNEVKGFHVDDDTVFIGVRGAIFICNRGSGRVKGTLQMGQGGEFLRHAAEVIRTDDEFLYFIDWDKVSVFERRTMQKITDLVGSGTNGRGLVIGDNYIYFFPHLPQTNEKIVYVWKKHDWKEVAKLHTDQIIDVEEGSDHVTTKDVSGHTKKWNLKSWALEETIDQASNLPKFHWTADSIVVSQEGGLCEGLRKELQKITKGQAPLVIVYSDLDTYIVAEPQFVSANEELFSKDLNAIETQLG